MVMLALISDKNKFSGKLTKFWTNSYAYHIGFVDVDSDTFYDMHWTPRKTSWSGHKYKNYIFYVTGLTKLQCEEYMKMDSLKQRYGWKDYTLFALRPLFHLFGYSTINAGGWICSEMVNEWLWRDKESSTPFYPKLAPPSPADFELWLEQKDVTLKK